MFRVTEGKNSDSENRCIQCGVTLLDWEEVCPFCDEELPDPITAQ